MTLIDAARADDRPDRDGEPHESEARIRALEREVRLGRLFGEVAAALTSKGSFDETLGRAAEVIVHFLGVPWVRIWHIDPRVGELVLRVAAGQGAHHDAVGTRATRESATVRIAREGAPYVTPDIASDSMVTDIDPARREGCTAFAGFPLRIADHTLGVLSIFAREPFETDSLETLAAVANALALAIERKLTRDFVREEAEALEILNRVGRLLSAELDQQKLVQAVTDHATRLAGAEFGAFFYNVTDERGEAYMLYSLSGVPREAFSKFPMPRNTRVFAPTFAGEGIVRVDDITKDPRYGHNAPHKGMPEGHLPVRSYLAVPVVGRGGDVLGGLFFGHSEAGVFTARAETLVTGVAGQAAIAMDNARLFREAEAASRMREDVMAVVSHDLRNPLSSILSSAALGHALLEDSQHSAKRHIETIQRSAERMKRLVSDLLDIASIDAGRFVIEPAHHHAAGILREACEIMNPIAIEKNQRIEAHDISSALTLHCDKDRLLQVLSNLMGNAIKFTRRGGLLEVDAQADGPLIRFSVRDNGPGISAEQMPRLFERYWQAKRDSRHGIGLGLSIARGIVEAHGGKIWCESTPGAGATFLFTVPVDPPAEASRRRPS